VESIGIQTGLSAAQPITGPLSIVGTALHILEDKG
jgi:hypothetical protein